MLIASSSQLCLLILSCQQDFYALTVINNKENKEKLGIKEKPEGKKTSEEAQEEKTINYLIEKRTDKNNAVKYVSSGKSYNTVDACIKAIVGDSFKPLPPDPAAAKEFTNKYVTINIDDK